MVANLLQQATLAYTTLAGKYFDDVFTDKGNDAFGIFRSVDYFFHLEVLFGMIYNKCKYTAFC